MLLHLKIKMIRNTGVGREVSQVTENEMGVCAFPGHASDGSASRFARYCTVTDAPEMAVFFQFADAVFSNAEKPQGPLLQKHRSKVQQIVSKKLSDFPGIGFSETP